MRTFRRSSTEATIRNDPHDLFGFGNNLTCTGWEPHHHPSILSTKLCFLQVWR